VAFQPTTLQANGMLAEAEAARALKPPNFWNNLFQKDGHNR
jgi:hypothetical protein